MILDNVVPESHKIDVAHANFIMGLVCALKPTKILELGIGGGRAASAISSANLFNQNMPFYTIVDNWEIFDYKSPGNIKIPDCLLRIVTSNEKDFVFSTTEQYDFIMSDADHLHTQEWFTHVYDNLLLPDGVLIYHDINLFPEIDGNYPNLLEILHICKAKGIHHKLFNKSSRPEERCHRGLLVIFKH